MSLLLICFTLNAQHKPDYLTIKELDSILNLYKKKNKIDSLTTLAHDACIYYYKKRDLKKAIFYAKKEIREGENTFSHKKKKKNLYQLGRLYYLNNNFKKSIEILKKVINDYKTDEITYKTYCEIGRNHNRLGDFYQAIYYYEKGLSNKSLLNTSSLINYYNNLSILYYNLGTEKSLKKEFKLLQKMDSLIKKSKKNYIQTQRLNNAYANFYNTDLNFNFKKSKLYYLKTLENAISHNDSSFISTSYSNLGLLYNKQRKDSALYFLKNGIKYSKLNESYNLQLNLADYYYYNKRYNKSLDCLNRILFQSNINNSKYSPHQVPEIEKLISSKIRPYLILALKEKTKNYLKLYEKSKNKKNLILALKNILLADQLLTDSRKNIYEDKSKLIWQKDATSIYALAVKTCVALNKPEKALYFIEKNKTLLLIDNILEKNTKANSGIPKDILEKEQSLRNKIYNLENELINNTNKKLKDKYHSFKIRHSNFIQNLKKNYPQYNHSTNLSITKNLDSIKKNIDSNTTILNYLLNKSEGYLLAISKDKTQLIELKGIPNLEKQISNYLELINYPATSRNHQDSFYKLSNEIYNKILPFKKDGILKKKLLIVPDNVLQYISFENLYRNNKYLIEDHEVSYAYSLSFLKTNQKITRNATKNFIGFAIKNYNYDNLKDLPNNIAEIDKISNKLNGEKLLNIQATKTNFFSKIKDYKIIHLSTHANANDSISPWIAFKNKKLYLNELYTAKNQAELVVINACNSSLGKINSGEGVFSLARGFFYSGAKSVISSLWNVNDKSNSEITINFYKYLKKGKTKSAALRQAKLDYLSTHSLSEASPYYWSSLILIGDDSTIELNNNNKYLIYSIIILTILFLVIFFYKKIKNVG